MPISSYVVRYEDGRLTQVLASLGTRREVTIGNPAHDGLPIVTDTRTTGEAKRLGEELEQLPGIKSVTLVYHNFEDTLE